MRLAHCSDLHLLSLEGARWLDFANKRWIGGLNLLTSRSRHHHTAAFEDMVADFATEGVEHVVCTGDVTNLALEVEFKYARARFDKIAIGPTHVTVIPGNHDAYVAHGARHFAEIFPAYFRCDPGWEWPHDGDDPLGAPWPVVRVRDRVAIIGLTTSLQTPWFTAWGRVGTRQLERLEEVLSDDRLADKARVVLIHHPAAGRRAMSKVRGLRDHEAFAQVLCRAGAELVLHGHEHEDLAEVLPGPHGVIPVLGIASGTYDPGKVRVGRIARYRVFDFEACGPTRADIRIAHHLRVWDRGKRAFAREVDAFRSGATADAAIA